MDELKRQVTYPQRQTDPWADKFALGLGRNVSPMCPFLWSSMCGSSLFVLEHLPLDGDGDAGGLAWQESGE